MGMGMGAGTGTGTKPKLDYGNWIRKRKLLILGSCALVTGVSILMPFGPVYRIVMVCLFAAAQISFLLPLLSYAFFSQKGGRFQDKVYELIISHLGPPMAGRLLDIGAGNGVLAVKLARLHAEAEVVGIDHWDEEWGYSRKTCERNARAAGVEGRVRFQKGDAAALELADEEFDGAISNLTFHEVRTAADKRKVVREALRVVKKGGRFAFVDCFYDEKLYGKGAELMDYLEGLGIRGFEMRPLWEMMEVPLLLRHPKILGRVGMIHGTK